MEMKDIEGFEGKYAVTTTGQVYSYKLKDFLALDINNKGYPRVKLYKNGIKANYLVSRLVAQTFIPNPENKETVDHIDRNPTNNNVENLRWATPQEQETNKDLELKYQHIKDMAEISAKKSKRKTAMCDPKTGEILRIFDSCSEAAEIVLGDKSKNGHISEVCNGKRKTAHGYSWKYLENPIFDAPII